MVSHFVLIMLNQKVLLTSAISNGLPFVLIMLNQKVLLTSAIRNGLPYCLNRVKLWQCLPLFPAGDAEPDEGNQWAVQRDDGYLRNPDQLAGGRWQQQQANEERQEGPAVVRCVWVSVCAWCPVLRGLDEVWSEMCKWLSVLMCGICHVWFVNCFWMVQNMHFCVQESEHILCNCTFKLGKTLKNVFLILNFLWMLFWYHISCHLIHSRFFVSPQLLQK